MTGRFSRRLQHRHRRAAEPDAGGRAFFAVAKDAHRPFVVEAASGTATALGTRFSVHEWGGNASVAVEESAVSVTAPDGSSAVLNVGESVSYGPGGMQQIARVDVESDLAMRPGKLIFEDRPLQQVVADVNRYRSGTIRILDAKLMDLRVSGIFNIAEPDAVLTTITETLPVRAVRLTDYLVLLRGT
ncbi:FecR family protein [Halomonas sp. 3A7M]|uniref:FecR family protein n=1 Tax=Halomonas sp. 3A7M TaxID=2742616 RepID=UPI001865B068|nr:FecR domain-containing protein [Halomonas sp. 3A7M]